MTDKLANLPAPSGAIATHGPAVDRTRKAPHVSKPESWLEKTKAVLAVVEVVAEEAILAAEDLEKPGTEKKAWVVEHVTGWLRDAEGRFDVLPPGIEGLVFSGIEWGLSMIVERVFRRLNAAGLVNAAAT